MSEAKIMQKIVYKGTLQLQSPLLIGTGMETDNRKNEADVHVLKDKQEQPFIPGTSLAGVLRDWLAGVNAEAAENLFGFVTQNENSMNDVQSAIAVSDVILKNAEVMVRDGVSIDGYTGTGIKGAKYDYEAVERGAKGDFSMIITVREYQEKKIPELESLIECLADRLCSGIRVGALTAKGFGLVAVPDITVYYYNFNVKNSVVSWLLKQPSKKQYRGKTIANNAGNTFVVDGEFALKTSLLLRDLNQNEKKGDTKINAVPMKSKNDYLIPGTSLKGVLRHQAEKILTVLGKPESDLDKLMGFSKESESRKSRFFVDEVYFKDGVFEKEQTRNRIDRFTGGTVESALFTNRALWQKTENLPVLHIHYEIRECEDWEAGLALFLLKDLWTGNIAIGGEKSIGRGLLRGLKATVNFQNRKYVIEADGKTLPEDREQLEKFALACPLKERRLYNYEHRISKTAVKNPGRKLSDRKSKR